MKRESVTILQPLPKPKAKGSCAPCRGSAEPIPTILFRGEAVWRELNDKERTRTTAINVSDVLDAVVRLLRREARQNGAHQPQPPRINFESPANIQKPDA